MNSDLDDWNDLLRTLTPDEMAAYQAELDAIVWDPPAADEPSGFPIMPYDPVWNPRPGPLYR